jgi:hypothetical protein
MAWNIVTSKWDWLWWTWAIDNNTKWKWRNSDWSFLDYTQINWNGNFLDTHSWSYLIIVNLDESYDLEYNLSSSGEFFTKPKSDIISSAKIMNYKQTLKTTLDNTEFLNILKYSLYSE